MSESRLDRRSRLMWNSPLMCKRKIRREPLRKNFYVDKTSGTTRIVEIVPSLNVEKDDGEHQSSVGTTNLFDFLEKQ